MRIISRRSFNTTLAMSRKSSRLLKILGRRRYFPALIAQHRVWGYAQDLCESLLRQPPPHSSEAETTRCEHDCLLPAHSDIEILSVIVGRVLDRNPFPLTGANDPNALAVADIEATAQFDRA